MKRIVALFVALAFASPTFAAEPEKKKPDPEAAFKKMDANSDGKLSLDEFKGKKEGDKAAKAEKNFGNRDKDKDGFLTLEEFKAAPKKKDK